MIFRLDGEVGELLALSAIIREWRRRNDNQKVFVETNNPEIFTGNPEIEMAAISIPVVGEYFDMNLVRWHELGIPVVEVYAKAIFGDKNLATWKMEMFHTEADEEVANLMVPKTDKPIAVYSFSSSVISDEASEGVFRVLKSLGYEVVTVDHSSLQTWGSIHAVIGMADLFVGSDGDTAAVAMTTKTPAVVCYSYRAPSCFPPFRGNVPFFALVPSRKLCEHGPVCHSRHSRVEFSKFYSQDCVSNDKFCCRDRDLRKEVVSAIGRIADKA